MLILPFALVVGFLAGLAAGGTWRALFQLKFRCPIVVALAIGVQVGLALPALQSWPTALRFSLICATYAAVGIWLIYNARGRTGGVYVGFVLLAVGWLLNLIAILPNGGMPVSAWAMREAGIKPTTSVGNGHLAKHVLVSSGTWFRFLGDVIPVSFFQAVVSVGDIVMAAGVVVLVAGAMRARGPELDAVDQATKPVVAQPKTIEDSVVDASVRQGLT